MNPLKLMLRINWNSRRFRVLDFGFAGIAILIGAFLESQAWVLGGFAALVLAVINPMGRLQKGLFGFIRPGPGTHKK